MLNSPKSSLTIQETLKYLVFSYCDILHFFHTWARRSSRRASFLSLLALFFARLASNWSDRVFSLAFSAFDLWILSISTRLFLKTLPLTFMYISWYMCLSIFLASRYLRSKRLRTRILLIQRIFVGSLASLVPLRLPGNKWEREYNSYNSLDGNMLKQKLELLKDIHIYRVNHTISRVAALPFGLFHSASTRTRVDLCRFPDNEAILDQLPDVLSCKGLVT